MTPIDLLMPAYNCAAWLDAMMVSLVGQSFRDWRLIARDDHSTDGTLSLLAQWQAKLGERMVVLAADGSANLGVVGSYDVLLSSSTSRLVMLADADDVWLPDKIARTLAAMEQAEARLGSETPIAICTDAQVVDEALRPIARSYWRWARLDPAAPMTPRRVVMESISLGPTMMLNRALLRLALPIDAAAPNPDWWLAVAAAAFGEVVPLNEQTMLYRRHGSNDTTLPYTHSLPDILARMIRAPRSARARTLFLLRRSARLAAAFHAHYRGRIDPEEAAALDALASLEASGAVGRRIDLLRYGLRFGSPLKTLGLLALV